MGPRLRPSVAHVLHAPGGVSSLPLSTGGPADSGIGRTTKSFDLQGDPSRLPTSGLARRKQCKIAPDWGAPHIPTTTLLGPCAMQAPHLAGLGRAVYMSHISTKVTPAIQTQGRPGKCGVPETPEGRPTAMPRRVGCRVPYACSRHLWSADMRHIPSVPEVCTLRGFKQRAAGPSSVGCYVLLSKTCYDTETGGGLAPPAET